MRERSRMPSVIVGWKRPPLPGGECAMRRVGMVWPSVKNAAVKLKGIRRLQPGVSWDHGVWLTGS